MSRCPPFHTFQSTVAAPVPPPYHRMHREALQPAGVRNNSCTLESVLTKSGQRAVLASCRPMARVLRHEVGRPGTEVNGPCSARDPAGAVPGSGIQARGPARHGPLSFFIFFSVFSDIFYFFLKNNLNRLNGPAR